MPLLMVCDVPANTPLPWGCWGVLQVLAAPGSPCVCMNQAGRSGAGSRRKGQGFCWTSCETPEQVNVRRYGCSYGLASKDAEVTIQRALNKQKPSSSIIFRHPIPTCIGRHLRDVGQQFRFNYTSDHHSSCLSLPLSHTLRNTWHWHIWKVHINYPWFGWKQGGRAMTGNHLIARDIVQLLNFSILHFRSHKQS